MRITFDCTVLHLSTQLFSFTIAQRCVKHKEVILTVFLIFARVTADMSIRNHANCLMIPQVSQYAADIQYGNDLAASS